MKKQQQEPVQTFSAETEKRYRHVGFFGSIKYGLTCDLECSFSRNLITRSSMHGFVVLDRDRPEKIREGDLFLNVLRNCRGVKNVEIPGKSYENFSVELDSGETLSPSWWRLIIYSEEMADSLRNSPITSYHAIAGWLIKARVKSAEKTLEKTEKKKIAARINKKLKG